MTTSDLKADLLGTSGAREVKKPLKVIPIGGLKGLDVALAKVSGAPQIGAAPGENRPALPLDQYVRHQTCMAPIAIGEGVNHHQAVMKANGKFIGGIGFVFQPIACISEQAGQSFADLVVRNANVLFAGSVDSCPSPGLIKHAPVKVPYIRLDQRIIPAEIVRRESPDISFENILSFPFVEFLLGREVRNEIRLFFGGKGCVSLTLGKEIHRTPRLRS